VTAGERAHERRGQQDVADGAESDQEDAQHVANKSCVARLRQSSLALAYGAAENHPLGG
jgi:hypothetical protein